MTGPAFSKAPRLNHVAMSVPADALDDDGRAALCAFYGDVFGFEEYGDLTQDRQRLVLRAHSHEQFVFLIAEDQPMTAPRLDHFGLSVATLEDFEEVARRAAAWLRDDWVRELQESGWGQWVINAAAREKSALTEAVETFLLENPPVGVADAVV